MAVHYRTQGFVLKKNDLREADQVFSIYTQDFGKLKILGKAIRKIKSKLRAGAELFYLSEIEFIQGKNHKTLTDAIVIDKFKNIRTCSLRSQNLDSVHSEAVHCELLRNSSYSLELRDDLERLKIAYQIAETADNLISGQEKDEKIWNLLNESFNKLDNCSLFIVHCSLIYHYFLWNLLSVLGYQVDLYNCAVCQKKLVPQKLYFNSKEGITCSECSENLKDKSEIPPDIIKILRLFLKRNWQILSRLRITNSHKKELEDISENYLKTYCEVIFRNEI